MVGQGVPKGKWDLGLGTGNGPAHASARLITPFMQLGSGMKTGIKKLKQFCIQWNKAMPNKDMPKGKKRD